ncbi:hypothetical protein BDV25DRAFT_161668 [Aspergillus avenaceus]|uniref:YMC020W-like alpha/beta hydrolase domain-containing protein n=1 Tax=Aspergillus avenaceus TaxID=36643 RepID=A0A5N6TKI1_ASPAV|nr:hypothetical protein BDV25DRAFT_161668 [Aspergillus avenaceus]
MAPTGSRKRIKSIPSTADSQSTPSHDGAASPSTGRERSGSQKRGSGNWYPGVWPVSRSSKAAPVTEVARESISVAQNIPSSVSTSSVSQLSPSRHPRNPTLQLTRKAGSSTRSLPANATTTRINIASDGSSSSPALEVQSDAVPSVTEPTDQKTPKDKGVDTENNTGENQSKTTTQILPTDTNTEEAAPVQEQTTPQPSGWISWLWAPSTTQKDTPGGTATETPEERSPEDQVPKEEEVPAVEHAPQEQVKPLETSEIEGTAQKRSWLQMWYGSSSSKGREEPQNGISSVADGSTSPDNLQAPTDDTNKTAVASTTTTSANNIKNSGWSFWFREAPQDTSQGKQQEAGSAETATQGSFAQKVKDGSESEPGQNVELTKKGSTKLKATKSSTALPDQGLPSMEAGSNVPSSNTSDAGASKQLQKILPNQVLPHFRDTFALQEKPSLLQSIGRFLHYNKTLNNKHVYMIKDPPHIKRALAIGIHGYFPAPLIRSVLGQPTGTSIRFSNMAADALRTWAEDHSFACDIEKIALEGEGRITERVDLLWKLLLNWVEKIRQADFILVACHSQGVPVAIMLVAKLISFGCLNAARVGICAMAGVNLGPFTDYKSRWISGSAGELFEFAQPHSKVSKEYEAALKSSLDFGVRISYIGSIDDQLVSLESSFFSPVSHPYIYRAVFVDGRVHAPSFLSHLVGFALKLRNIGVPDHGLIRELSSPLAGSLYSGEGHSRLYDDEAVYRLAIEFALETSNVQGATFDIKRSPPASINPYILPFAMRGILEEEHVRHELYDETMELLRQFDDWKPTSKVLKDVKFRLEGIRSKL